MLIVMQKDATPEQIDRINEEIKKLGLTPVAIPGSERIAIGIIGNDEIGRASCRERV